MTNSNDNKIKAYSPSGYFWMSLLFSPVCVLIMKYKNSKTLPSGNLIRRQANMYLLIFIFILLAVFISIFWESYVLVKWIYNQNDIKLLTDFMYQGFDANSVKEALKESAKQSTTLNIALNLGDVREIFSYVVWLFFAFYLGASAKKIELPEFNKLNKEKKIYSKAPLIPIILGIIVMIGLNYAIIYGSAFSATYTASNFASKTKAVEVMEGKDKIEEKVAPSDEEANTLIKNEQALSPIEEALNLDGIIELSLPNNYSLSTVNQSSVEKSFQYSIKNIADSSAFWNWTVYIVPLEAIQHYDSICASGNCMRNFTIFPKETDYLSDLEAIKKANESNVKILNDQRYYTFTKPVDGDTGYIRSYVTYFNDIRVVFNAWTESESKTDIHDDFIADVEILNIK